MFQYIYMYIYIYVYIQSCTLRFIETFKITIDSLSHTKNAKLQHGNTFFENMSDIQES